MTLEDLLSRLEDAKTRFGPREAERVARLLSALERRRFSDADLLGRFHEAVLFIRAHPHDAEILRRAEHILASFAGRVAELRAAGVDLSALEEPKISGIAGTALSAIFTYPAACCLAARHPGEVEIDWENHEAPVRLGSTLPRFIPLLEEDALVEANVPHAAWVRAARGRLRSDLAWLLGRFAALPGSFEERAELYDSLQLPIHWELGDGPTTRTRARVAVGKVFFQDAPLLRRSDVSLAAELAAPPLPIERVSRRAAEALLDLTHDNSAMRYRELYGYTFPDPNSVVKAEAGRGVAFFMWGAPPEHRLPLRAYHAGLIVKNDVPVGYLETLSLFERVEVGFNVYYTFREGESAWLYGRLLRLFNQVLGASCFSVDPYQIGHGNEEAIEAGAFWFYRKLGFRAVRPEPARLAEREAKKIRTRPGYRTPLRTLRRMAEGPMFFEAPGTPLGLWDRFEVRKLGMAVSRRMAQRFGGDALRMRRASVVEVARALGVKPSRWSLSEQWAFSNLALVLGLIPGLAAWSEAEKRAAAAVIRAKAGRDETRYLRLLQRHARLRAAFLKLGS